MPKNDERKSVRCSFCGKHQEQVARIIAGPGAYICNECVHLCMSILDDTYDPEEQAGPDIPDVIPTPREIRDVIGSTPSDRFDHFIHDIVNASMGKNDIRMSEETHLAMTRMRAFMFEHVYENPVAKSEESKAERLMETLYLHFLHHIDSLPDEFRGLLEQGEPREQVVCDYVGAMTDRYAIAVYDDIYIPKSWMG